MTNTTQPTRNLARVTTLGLNHVNLVVADIDRSAAFYTQALGMQVAQVTGEITFLATPGAADQLALQRSGGDLDRASGKTRRPGDSGGVDHIGFDVADPATLEALITAVQATRGFPC